MSWFDGVPAAQLFAGPPANYPAAAAASAAAQNLMAGASGNFSQPYVPSSFLQQGKIGMSLIGSLAGVITGQGAATTAIVTLGLVNSAGSISGTSILASEALTVTSLSGKPWLLNFQSVIRTVGYGTTTISTTLLTTGTLDIGGSAVGTPVSSICTPVSVTTIDASVNQWLYATVTFSTASATNSCTLQQVILLGAS